MDEKYRYEVLAGYVGIRCRELLREIARSKEMLIYAGPVNKSSSSYVDMNSSVPIGIKSSVVPEREEFA